jgi:hypothetical protein
LVSLAVVFALGAIGVWLTHEARVFGVVMLAAGTVAALMVMYFEWRHRMHRRFIGEAGGYDDREHDLEIEERVEVRHAA